MVEKLVYVMVVVMVVSLDTPLVDHLVRQTAVK